MDLIKDRLAHILRAKNLTSTQFAELMQIQPSNVSHLLSGRNKPSLDFLIKLKELFPEYNFDWIIMGRKPITVSEKNTLPHIQDDLFSNQDSINKVENPDVSNRKQNDVTYVDAVVMDVKQDISCIISNGVRQIIYVYDDKTFEIYNVRR